MGGVMKMQVCTRADRIVVPSPGGPRIEQRSLLENVAAML
jgi:hypothetical protein